LTVVLLKSSFFLSQELLTQPFCSFRCSCICITKTIKSVLPAVLASKLTLTVSSMPSRRAQQPEPPQPRQHCTQKPMRPCQRTRSLKNHPLSSGGQHRRNPSATLGSAKRSVDEHLWQETKVHLCLGNDITFQPICLAWFTAAIRSLSDESMTLSWSSSSYCKVAPGKNKEQT